MWSFEIEKRMKHIARKRFGQHFLTDRGIIEDIIQAIDPKPGDPMVEIGPGLAAMTQPLVERLGHLTVIELDRDLAKQLRAHPQLTVVTLQHFHAHLVSSFGCGRCDRRPALHAAKGSD